ncbi:DNA polymerase [Stenotrophomonas phage Moby]|uniref:DNA-directed DNA polymerase n=1 Tax=Stenotrophomonas phage Moby TaxID=2601680 RepID=A0A5P8PM75_9CAUD|nr:DNA polymerase [Stenotrophomonas phage Moby]QFR57782.1 DNA polymerase [Stenotrophomonas phage Moby]
MFYTFCEKVGSRIYHRYVNAAGERKQEVVSEVPLELFMKSRDGEVRSLYGDRLKRFQFNSISEAADFEKRMEGVEPIFGQTDPVQQFISQKYKGKIKFDFNKFRILNFDIEVRTDGYDDEDEAQVRRVFSNEAETWTVGEIRNYDGATQYEVYDLMHDRWYPIESCPQLMVGGFPEADEAKYEITSIALKMFGKDKKITLGQKDYQPKDKNQIYTRFNSEAELLLEFVNIVRMLDPDILTGWNIEEFDIPYVVHRLQKLHGEETANRLSPFHKDTKKCLQHYIADKDNDMPSYRILGVTVLDGIKLFKKFVLRKYESYRLDYIGESVVKERKIDYSEYNNDLNKLYMMDFDKFIAYNEKDVELVEKIDKNKQLIRLAITMIMMTKSKYRDVMGKVKLWDNLIYNMLLEDNIVIPPAIRRRSEGKIIGAWVKDPVAGKYRYVVSLDLTSLYPSICMMYNMSPETLVREEMGTLDYVTRLVAGEDLAVDMKAKGYCMAANGSAYRLDIVGVLPRGMKYVFDTRQDYKKKMKDVKQKREDVLSAGGKNTDQEYIEWDELVSEYNAAQEAMKVLANSGYGVTAQDSFRYYNRSIAQGITLTGQVTIQTVVHKTNEYLNKRFGTTRDYVITADTDSMYLALENVPTNATDAAAAIEELDQFVEKELQPFIDQTFRELSDRMGCPKNMMDMKREALSDVGIWRAKKNYVLRVWDMEGVRYAEPEMKMMGIETAKSSTPMIVRKELEECLKIMCSGTEKELQDELARFKKVYYNSGIEEIAKPLGVSDLTSYSLTDKRIPYQSKAAILHNKLIQEKGLSKTVERIRNGNKVKLALLKERNPLRNKYIAFIGELPKEFGLDEYVDYDGQYESTFMSPVKSFTDLIGWKTEQISSLEDLFGW